MTPQRSRGQSTVEFALSEEDALARTRVDDSGVEEKEPEKPEWPGKLSPEVYLKRYPKGKYAGLAKEVLGL